MQRLSSDLTGESITAPFPPFLFSFLSKETRNVLVRKLQITTTTALLENRIVSIESILLNTDLKLFFRVGENRLVMNKVYEDHSLRGRRPHLTK